MTIIIICIIILLIDIITKTIVSNNLILDETISIINNFFNITYVHNKGAAFSILVGKQTFLIITSIIIITILIIYLKKNKPTKKLDIISYGLLLGGTIGNLLDRVRLGYVIDFLDFKILGYNFPIFNVADIGIVVGVILLIISQLGGTNERIKSRGK